MAILYPNEVQTTCKSCNTQEIIPVSRIGRIESRNYSGPGNICSACGDIIPVSREAIEEAKNRTEQITV